VQPLLYYLFNLVEQCTWAWRVEGGLCGILRIFLKKFQVINDKFSTNNMLLKYRLYVCNELTATINSLCAFVCGLTLTSVGDNRCCQISAGCCR